MNQVTNKKLMLLMLRLETIKESTKQQDLDNYGREIVQSNLPLTIPQSIIRQHKVKGTRMLKRGKRGVNELQLSLL